MLRLGFQPTVVEAWFSCLQGLSRQALVAGAVYGASKATTGIIPEGDPLSVVGMLSHLAMPTTGRLSLVTRINSLGCFVLWTTCLALVGCRSLLPSAGRGLLLPVCESNLLLARWLTSLSRFGLPDVALVQIWLIPIGRLRPLATTVLLVGTVVCCG